MRQQYETQPVCQPEFRADQQLETNIIALRAEGSQKFNIQATPSFVVNGKTHSGGRSIDDFAELIDGLTASN